MNNMKVLSGYELVTKGAIKIDATLPEIGLKDVLPNGSWLQQKQIQSALEARKHLIEIERIEKSGVLSHAEWQEELMLAEVTQKVGGHWQFLGHNVGKQLFLEPEEALFLMEVNCLLLKHNGIKVSLQQAYSLLLRGKVKLMQYKVYSSLSRLGYRIYRHEKSKQTAHKRNINLVLHSDDNENVKKDVKVHPSEPPDSKPNICDEENMTVDQELKCDTDDNITDTPEPVINDEIPLTRQNQKDCNQSNMQVKWENEKVLKKLKNRKLRPCNVEIIHNHLDNLPHLLEKRVVTVQVPDKKYIPNNINLTVSSYNINLSNIDMKTAKLDSSDSNIYNVNDEVNGSHIRRLRNTSMTSQRSYWTPQSQSYSFQPQGFQFLPRPFAFWRPRQNFHYYNLNMLFQRPFHPSWFIGPQYQFFTPFPPPLFRPNIANNRRKRTRGSAKKSHLDGIKNLAAKLKQLLLSGNTHQQQIESLQRLIQTYNTRYQTRIRLSQDFTIVFDENIIETIELDDDAEPQNKKRRIADHGPAFEENLNALKQVALRLQDLDIKKISSTRHRRAFSKLLKTFNESYIEEYCLNDNFEITNRRQIILDDSTDSDCKIQGEETMQLSSGKKLKNPFNILKRISEKQIASVDEPSTSKPQDILPDINNKYSDILVNAFTKDWLPSENDFGRAEITTKDCEINWNNIRREEFLYDFVKVQKYNYNNWVDLKIAFMNGIQEVIAEFQNHMPSMNMRINSIVKPEDCSDMESVLNKLQIIRNNKKISDECTLAIDYDVFNRDVQNFRKSQRPAPHFRIICIDELSNIPSGEEIATLCSKYEDNVAIVFAVVGVGSISYLQINPTDLPVYISKSA